MSIFGFILVCSDTSMSCTMGAGTQRDLCLIILMGCFVTYARAEAMSHVRLPLVLSLVWVLVRSLQLGLIDLWV